MEHGTSFLSAFLGLIFVLGLIFLFSYLFKKFGGPLLTGTAAGKKKTELELLDIRSVDPKNRLVLVRCREKDYLLMTGETNLVVDSYPANKDNVPATQEAPNDTL